MGRGYGGKGSHCPMLLSEIVALIRLLQLDVGGSGVHTAFSENGRTVYIAKNLHVMINVFSLHDNYVQTTGS